MSPYLLAAIAEVESGRSVHALNVGGEAVLAESRIDGVTLALRSDKNVDVGLMQVSLRYWRKEKDLNVYRLLDPFVNVETGASILAGYWAQTGNLEFAIGRYHTGNPERGKEYARSVIRRWRDRPSLLVCAEIPG